jgi:hypothetical protein
MNAKTDFTLNFDPEAWEYSVVSHKPRRWLPSSVPSTQAINPRAWQTRAARGLSWHRTGRAARAERPR